jgi:hypothetical protein
MTTAALAVTAVSIVTFLLLTAISVWVLKSVLTPEDEEEESADPPGDPSA